VVAGIYGVYTADKRGMRKRLLTTKKFLKGRNATGL